MQQRKRRPQKLSDTCPKCGYCDKCGRANAAPFIPYVAPCIPYVPPTGPYPFYQWQTPWIPGTVFTVTNAGDVVSGAACNSDTPIFGTLTAD